MAIISDSKKFIFIHPPKTGGSSITAALKEYANETIVIGPHSRFKEDDQVDTWENDTKRGKHESAIRIRNREPQKFKEYFKFGVIRSPYDRALSYFLYEMRESLLGTLYGLLYPELLQEDGHMHISKDLLNKILQPTHEQLQIWNSWYIQAFREWCDGSMATGPTGIKGIDWENSALKRDEPFMGVVEGRQADYYCDENNNPIIDGLIGFGTLEENFEKLCEHLSLNFEPLSRKLYSRDIIGDCTWDIPRGRDYILNVFYGYENAKLLEEVYSVDFEVFKFEKLSKYLE